MSYFRTAISPTSHSVGTLAKQCKVHATLSLTTRIGAACDRQELLNALQLLRLRKRTMITTGSVDL